MDDEQGKPEPKLHAPIIILGFICFAICDLLSLIPFVADVLDAGFAAVVVVLALSGIGGTLVLGVNFLAFIVKLFPVLQAIPFYTIAWAVAVITDRSQKAKKLAEVTVAAAQAGEKLAGGATGEIPGAGEATATGGGAGKLGEGTKGGTAAGETGKAAEGTSAQAQGGGRPSETSTERKPEAGRPSEAPEKSPEGAGGPEEKGPQKPEIAKEALGEQPTPFEEMEKSFKETPTEQPKSPGAQEEEPPKSRIEKVNKNIQNKLDGPGGQDNGAGQGEAGEKEEEEDLPEAA